jgi:antitoxin component YwqK of YwqJK toxin-antitoxin module
MIYISINTTSFSLATIKVLLALLGSLLIFSGCRKIDKQSVTTAIVIPEIEIPKEDLVLNQNEGKWYSEGQPYSGFALIYHPDGSIAERIGFYEGKKEGITHKWYLDGTHKYKVTYHANKKNGVAKNWSNGEVLIAESNFENGVVNGVQTRWYESGNIFKKANINNGIEEGLQQTWWENGKLYVNYEAKNGRVYGLKRSTLCYELENEIIQK